MIKHGTKFQITTAVAMKRKICNFKYKLCNEFNFYNEAKINFICFSKPKPITQKNFKLRRYLYIISRYHEQLVLITMLAHNVTTMILHVLSAFYFMYIVLFCILLKGQSFKLFVRFQASNFHEIFQQRK